MVRRGTPQCANQFRGHYYVRISGYYSAGSYCVEFPAALDAEKAPSTKITYDNSYHHSDEINFRKVDETWDAKLPCNPEFSPFDNR